jgi:hypothetical protein
MSRALIVALYLCDHRKKCRMTQMHMTPPPLVSSNKTILNMKPVSGSVGVGDTITDVGMISGVDSQLS